jgi:hypothetical protein
LPVLVAPTMATWKVQSVVRGAGGFMFGRLP